MEKPEQEGDQERLLAQLTEDISSFAKVLESFALSPESDIRVSTINSLGIIFTLDNCYALEGRPGTARQGEENEMLLPRAMEEMRGIWPEIQRRGGILIERKRHNLGSRFEEGIGYEYRIKFPFIVASSKSTNLNGFANLIFFNNKDTSYSFIIEVEAHEKHEKEDKDAFVNALKIFDGENPFGQNPNIDEIIRTDNFMETLPNSFQEAIAQSDNASRHYGTLRTAYANITRQAIELGDKAVALREIGQILAQYTDKAGYVKEILPNIPQGLRVVAGKYKDFGQMEIAQELEKIDAEVVALDTKRFRLHRAIEEFAFRYMTGRHKELVAFDVRRSVEAYGERIVNIENTNLEIYDSKESMCIEFGNGQAGRQVDYTSFVGAERNFDDDDDLASRVVSFLVEKYPGLVAENNFEIKTWHAPHLDDYEGYLVSSLQISKRSILNAASAMQVEPDKLFDMIRKDIGQMVVAATVGTKDDT